MRILYFFGIFFLITSCATEKLNLSPLSEALGDQAKDSDKNSDIQTAFRINIKQNVNAAELTNLIASFPKFQNSRLNEEVIELKYSLQNYLYAIDNNNAAGKEKTGKDFEKSYKNIQKLRRFLNKDDDEVINRYLVRIKTNITVIENSLHGNKIKITQ